MPIQAIFFDLDGTLADTAPDLAAALNKVREEDGLPHLPLSQLRPMTSHGARGMLGLGLNLTPEDAAYPAYVARFLGHYERALCVETRLFDGMAELLAKLEVANIAWGVVTNKAARFTQPLMDQLGLTQRAAAIVSGDSAARAKPHPDPLLLAAQIADVPAHACLYVGDDLRDIEAGRAAGMGTVAVRYGYLGEGLPVESWGADHLIAHPRELISLIT